MIERLVILNDVSIARGGATSIALESLRALRARGVPVTMIVGDGGRNPELAALDVEVVALDQELLLDAGRLNAFARGIFNPHSKRLIEDWVRRNDTPRTVYHIHTWTKILSPSIFAALQSVRARLVISAHDFFLVCPNGGYVFYNSGETCSLTPMSLACVGANCDKHSYLQKLWRVARQASQAARLTFDRDGPLVLAVHDDMREGLERGGVPSAAIRVLRNPVRPFARERVKAEENREAFFIGRLNDEKGADIAAAAAQRADVPLRIIGDGPMRESIRSDYPAVICEGRRSHDEIADLIVRARVLIVSSRYPEPFGLVAVEALQSGVPVIINASAMLCREIVAHEAGIGIDQRDPAALPQALRAMFDDDDRVARMSGNAFSRTGDLALSPQDWADELIAIYAGRTDGAPR